MCGHDNFAETFAENFSMSEFFGRLPVWFRRRAVCVCVSVFIYVLPMESAYGKICLTTQMCIAAVPTTTQAKCNFWQRQRNIYSMNTK